MGLSTNFSLSQKDWDFVKELTKVASVNVLSHQVRITMKPGENLGTNKENPLIFPSNWNLQYVGLRQGKYESDNVVTMTWEIIENLS